MFAGQHTKVKFSFLEGYYDCHHFTAKKKKKKKKWYRYSRTFVQYKHVYMYIAS